MRFNLNTKVRKIKFRSPLFVLQVVLAVGFAIPISPIFGAETTLVSVSSTGIQGLGFNEHPAISADGRFLAFKSSVDNLVAGDTNHSDDIFVRDQLTNQTTRVSVDSGGAQAILFSSNPSINADGRFVAFSSFADNLVSGDNNQTFDVFVRDRLLKQTTRVSLNSAGVQGFDYSDFPSISSDGRFVAFASPNEFVSDDTNGAVDVFVRDRLINQTTRVSLNNTGVEANDHSGNIDLGTGFSSDIIQLAINANGRFVAFRSQATNLVAGDTNGAKDIFVRDRTAKLTSRVSVNSAGVQANNESKAPSISADGRFVAFASNANNLVAGDTNGAWDIFIRDRSTNQTNRLSINNIGVQGNGESRNPTISADGRFVAFESFATNLVPSDTNGSWDFFVRDRLTNQTSRISVSSAGAQVTIGTFYGESTPAISADGRYIAFQSDAKNLVTNDTNLFSDIFLRDSLLNSSANADLKLTQSVSANLVSVGATFSYTATVSNQGPNNAANVVLSDFAPLNGTVGLPSLTPSQGTCYRGTTSICRLGTINAGQQASVQMSFTATRRGTAANRVTVNASPKDPTPFNAVTTNATIIP